MAEVTTGIIGAQKTAADENTAARNNMHAKVKKYGGKAAIAAAILPILYVLTSWINGWLNEPTAVHTVKQTAIQEVVVPSVETSVTALTISGACSEPIVVPKGWDIRSTITSGIRQEKKDTAGSEWTPMVDRASLYATRYCGEGQVLYQFISTS